MLRTGFPSFCTCPNCGYLTVVCEEMGDTFIHPKNLDEGFTEICPQCKTGKTADFVVADSHAIINAGFKKEDYG